MLFVFQYWNQKIVSKSRNLDFVKSYILRILIPEAPLRANKLDNLLGGATRLYVSKNILTLILLSCQNMDEFKAPPISSWQYLVKIWTNDT